jgi:outer membrane protein OmpA-like peptidoglycan-associated protein
MSVFGMNKLLISLSLATLTACGAHQPPQELVNARVAYDRAAAGNAQKLVPADLHGARTSLDVAERKFDNDGDSQATKDLAYIAMRKSQRAEALGNVAAANAVVASADLTIGKTQEAIIASQQGKLHATQDQLARQRGELVQQQQATEAERQARLDAEKKSHDAMDALSKNLSVKGDDRGTVITLSGGVLFATGKAIILPGAQAQLNEVADALKNQAEHHFVVEGHTDSQGTDMINAELSMRRANAVRDYLIVRGVAADAISTQGLGASHPIADNKTIEGRAMNRRVEIVVDRGGLSNSASASN